MDEGTFENFDGDVVADQKLNSILNSLPFKPTKTRFKLFFDRVDTPHCEEAMNKLLERVNDWELEGNKAIIAWNWRHMSDSGLPNRTYVEVEVIYRET